MQERSVPGAMESKSIGGERHGSHLQRGSLSWNRGTSGAPWESKGRSEEKKALRFSTVPRRTWAARGIVNVEAAGAVVPLAEMQARNVPGAMGRLSLGEVRHGSLLQ